MAFPESVAFTYNFKFDDEPELQNVRFIGRHSLFTFNYRCEIQYEILNNKPKVSAEINLTELLKIIIIVSITAAFLASFSFSTYLWFVFLFAIIAYAGNVFFIRMYLFDRFDKAFNQVVEKLDDLANSQKVWMQNSELCPACGELLTLYDSACPECGIVLGHRVFTKPFDVSKYTEKSIMYHFKPKTKK